MVEEAKNTGQKEIMMVNDGKEPPIESQCRRFSSDEDVPGSEFYGSQVDNYSLYVSGISIS